MTARAVPVLLACALALEAQAPPAPYLPDLSRWRLEILSGPGGWVTDPGQQVTFKLVDPGDPNPPKEERPSRDAYEDAESWRPPAPEPEKTPEQLKQERLRAEAERKANEWRHRTVRGWFNDEELSEPVDVNVSDTLSLTSRNGENRLVLLEPDSGARAARSWWVTTATTRLAVTVARNFRWGAWPWSPGARDSFPSGDLQVLEPDGTLAESGRTSPSGGRARWMEYTHPAPPPGTFTVRWVSSSYAEPAVVTVRVVLDPGTDREHRWRFDRLILPGSPPAILGTFDVDP